MIIPNLATHHSLHKCGRGQGQDAGGVGAKTREGTPFLPLSLLLLIQSQRDLSLSLAPQRWGGVGGREDCGGFPPIHAEAAFDCRHGGGR